MVDNVDCDNVCIINHVVRMPFDFIFHNYHSSNHDYYIAYTFQLTIANCFTTTIDTFLYNQCISICYIYRNCNND